MSGSESSRAPQATYSGDQTPFSITYTPPNGESSRGYSTQKEADAADAEAKRRKVQVSLSPLASILAYS
jgi:hypothetical protein